MEGSVKSITNTNYFSRVLNRFQDLRQSGKCDVTIKIQNQKFPAHRIFLIASCDYFRIMLTGKYNESQQNIIELKELNPEAFANILDYIYTGNLILNSDNVGEVLYLSDFLQFHSTKEECYKYIKASVTTKNALYIWKFAKEHFREDIKVTANEEILDNLKEILNTREFKRLDFEMLEEIFQDKSMITTPPDFLYDAIIKWIRYDIPNRKPKFRALTKYIQNQSIPEKFLQSEIFLDNFLKKRLSILSWMHGLYRTDSQ